MIKNNLIYKAIFNAAENPIIYANQEGIIQDCNPAAAKMFGYTREILIGKNVNILVPPPYAEQHDGFLERYKKTGKKNIIGTCREVNALKKDGSEIDILLSINEFKLDDTVGYVGVMTDLSLKKQAEEQNQLLLESASEGICGVDNEGVILFVNPAAASMLGYTVQELVGEKMHPLVHHSRPNGEKYPVETCPMYEAFTKGTTRHITDEVLWRKDKTSFPVHYSSNPIRQHNQVVGAVIMFSDITENKKYETQLKEKNKSLEEQTQKLNAANKELDQFAHIVSHDLKAPLRAVDMLATWIEEDSADQLSEDSKEHLKRMKERLARMSNLIVGILNYARAGEVDAEVETINLNEMLLEISDTLSPPDTFKIIIQENLPTLESQRIPLSQVFSNLISNAIKYHDKSHGEIEIGCKEEGAFYCFSVKDDGPGIPPDACEKIFKIFETLKARDEIESTGIGLTIVKKIIESQGGKVWVESKLGQGSTFFFTWPKNPAKKKASK